MTRADAVGIPSRDFERGLALLHVDDVAAARAEFEAKGAELVGDTFDTGACHIAIFRDPDENELVLHERYAPHAD